MPAAADAVPLVTPAISVSNHSPESGDIGPSVGPLMLKQMEDETEEEAVPLGREQYTDNSPSGKAHQREMLAPAAVWTTVKRLKDVTLMGKRFDDDDGRALYEFSHVCVLFWKLLKITDNKVRHQWQTNAALHHLKVQHGNVSRVGKRALKFEEEEHAKKQCMMAAAGGE